MVFDVYGPIEDQSHWDICKGIIDKTPSNIQINYCGAVEPDNIAATFDCYDLFLFPTLGENYGHVIAESLTVGTPVLISDRTPWRNLQEDRMGWDLSLDNEEGFIKTIETYSSMPVEQRLSWRKHIRSKIVERLVNEDVVNDNRQLFQSILG